MNQAHKILLGLGGAFLLSRVARAGNTGSGGGDDFSLSYLNAGCHLPRGIRNNNPGNIEYRSSEPWQGKVPFGQNHDLDCSFDPPLRVRRFEQFSSYVYGVRAMTKMLINWIELRGRDTLRDIITVYAPGHENDTAKYLSDVATWTGLGKDQRLTADFHTMRKIVQAMARKETGWQDAVSNSMFSAAWSLLSRPEGIGKLYDTYGIKPGGRVDKYWQLPEIEKRYLGRSAQAEQKIKHYNDPQYAIEHFGLHAIEFGNWMNQKDRANFLFATLVSLADMAKVMNAPHHKLGLEQRLSLAFGARGRGGFVAAFYQHHKIALINLTKTMGKGTFAHEYGHAIDEHLHLQLSGTGGMASGGRSTRHTTDLDRVDKGSVEYFFEKMFDAILWNADGSPSTYKRFLVNAKSQYLNRRTEIWARVFEGWMEMKFAQKGIQNTWAVTKGQPDIPDKRLIQKAEPWIRKIVRAAF